jgi:hypothetical protein
MEIIFSDKLTFGAKILVVLILILFSPILLIGSFLYFLWGILLYIAIWLKWRQRFVLFVYSDSPIWKEYIETKVIPKLQKHAVILNWSERKAWKNSLAILAFRYLVDIETSTLWH